MLKRLFWLALIATAAWITWLWVRRQQGGNLPPTPYPPPYSPPPHAITPPHTTTTEQSSMRDTASDVVTKQRDAKETAAEAHVAAETAITETDVEAAAEAAADIEAEAPVEDAVAVEAVSEGLAREVAGSVVTETHSEPTYAPAPPVMPAEPDAPEADESVGKALSNVSGYCVRCRTKRLIEDAYEETTESGRRAARGKCPVCGTNMFTFLKEDDGK